MKPVIVIISFLILYIKVSAQQLPQYTQYIFNSYILNPAITGIENYIDLKTSFRSQWEGIEGAPETATLSIHAPLGRKYRWANPISSPSGGNNPMSRSFVQEYTAAEPHHGIGLVAVLDKTGPIENTSANITYAYHLGLAARLNLALGVSAGISYISADRSKMTTVVSADAVLASPVSGEIQPDLAAGIWLYSSRYFLGVSGLQLAGGDLFTSTSDHRVGVLKRIPHLYAVTGYKAFLSEDIALLPSVLISKAGPATLSLDLNAKLALKDRFWIGGSVRRGDSFSALTGVNVSHFINFGYSYDFTTSMLQNVARGTHEVVLNILLNNKYKVVCPQRTW